MIVCVGDWQVCTWGEGGEIGECVFEGDGCVHVGEGE